MNKSILFSLLMLLISCSMIFEPPGEIPTVTDISPKRLEEGTEEIHIRFSTEMDRSSVEEGFRLAGPRFLVEGSFSWEGEDLLIFHPSRIEAKTEYALGIEGALSSRGLLMDPPFSHLFRLETGEEPFRIIDSMPETGSLEQPLEGSIRLDFSRAVDRESLYRSFDILPSAPLDYLWSDGDTRVELVPTEPLLPATEYRISISPLCVDEEGRALNDTYELSFTTLELPAAELERITIASTMESHVPDPQSLYSIEKMDTVSLLFDRAVENEERSQIVRLVPSVSHRIHWREEGRTAEIEMEEELLWEEVYPLYAGGSYYNLLCNGVNSRPPEVLQLYFCSDLEEEPLSFIPLEANQLLSPFDSTAAALDIHLSRAPEATIRLSDILGKISLYAVNGAASVSLESITIDPTDPPPPPLSVPGGAIEEGTASLSTLRIHFSIATGESSGRLIVQLSGDMEDSFGNRMGEDFTMSFNL